MQCTFNCLTSTQNHKVIVKQRSTQHLMVLFHITFTMWLVGHKCIAVAVILLDKDLQQLIGSVFTSPMDYVLWQPSWVARYSVLIKCRGVVKSKGYIMRATRDIKQRPYIPPLSSTVTTQYS